jgi:tetratricopeptide (TPR) repeat protein
LIKSRYILFWILVAAGLAALFFLTQKLGQSSAVQERPVQPLTNQPVATGAVHQAPDIVYPAPETGQLDVGSLPTPSVEAVSEVSLPDYQADFDGADIPLELREMLRDGYVAFSKGNLDHAAHLSLDALEMSYDYPAIRPTLYSLVGLCYEKLGYFDLAMEQYGEALSLYPEHRASYKAMRRLDPQFAETHLALPKLEVKKSKN